MTNKTTSKPEMKLDYFDTWTLPMFYTGVQKVYHATDSEEAYLKQINTLAPVPAKLELRIGAQVMLAKNVNVQSGLVNGARGVVVGFEKGNEGNAW